MTLTITELELTPGIWTPGGQILCVECHGPNWAFSGDPLDMERYKEQPLDDAADSAIALCDECGKSVWMVYKIAWEQKIVHALRSRGFEKAGMDQTGGMCSAAGLYLDGDEDGGQKYIWITESEDTDRPHDAPTFLVGWFHYENPYGDDAEGEDYEVLPFDEAVDYVEKLAKAGRHVSAE